jgi:ATP-dependent protease ClpP protease subunit
LIRIAGEIGLTGATAGELLAAVGDAAEVSITISSIGGDSNAALEIHDGLAGRNVEVEIVGNSFSAAVIIALAGSRIRMRRDALLMIHSARLFVFDTPEGLECAARRLRRVNARLLDLIGQRTEQPADVVVAWLAKDSYFTAPEALAAGLIDEISEPPPARVADARRVEASEPTQTEDEALALSLLTALGEIKVNRKGEFARAIQAWLAYKVTGLHPDRPGL